MRDDRRVDVPQVDELLDVLRVLPVPETRQIPVRPAFAIVLGGRLPVHLQDPATGFTQQTAQQVQVVHRTGRRRGLGRLVETLQDGGQHALRRAEDLCSTAHVVSLYTAGLGYGLGSPRLDGGAQLLNVHRVLVDVLLIDPSIDEQFAHQSMHQRQVRSRPDWQMHLRLTCHFRETRIHAHDPRLVRARDPVKNPHPQDGLAFGHVVAEQEHGVALVDVDVAAGLPVGTEALLHGGCRGCGAQSSVAVHVRGTDPGLSDDCLRVVLLEKQLAARVEAVGEGPFVIEKVSAAGDDVLHCGFPVRLDQYPVLAHQGHREPIPVTDALPAGEQALRSQPAMVHDVRRPAAHPDHGPVFHGDVDSAPVAAQHARGLHPTLHVGLIDPFSEDLINPRRPPLVPRVRGTCSPDLRNTVNHDKLLDNAAHNVHR